MVFLLGAQYRKGKYVQIQRDELIEGRFDVCYRDEAFRVLDEAEQGRGNERVGAGRPRRALLQKQLQDQGQRVRGKSH